MRRSIAREAERFANARANKREYPRYAEREDEWICRSVCLPPTVRANGIALIASREQERQYPRLIVFTIDIVPGDYVRHVAAGAALLSASRASLRNLTRN